MPTTPKDPRPFKRAILKLSGEALREPGSTDNISPEIVQRIASEIKEAVDTGLQLGVVVGGGNFWRGASASARGMDRATADYVGMLATVMNALALEGALSLIGVRCTVMSAIEMKNVAEPFIRRKAEHQLDKGTVIIFAAGTGSPFFSTDTTSALRASEMGADIILKATQVDGVYDSDPRKNPDAKRFETASTSWMPPRSASAWTTTSPSSSSTSAPPGTSLTHSALSRSEPSSTPSENLKL